MLFDWNLLEEDDEVVDELIDGFKRLSRDNMLTFISSVIWEMGFEYDEITDRIDQCDNCFYSIPDPAEKHDSSDE